MHIWGILACTLDVGDLYGLSHDGAWFEVVPCDIGGVDALGVQRELREGCTGIITPPPPREMWRIRAPHPWGPPLFFLIIRPNLGVHLGADVTPPCSRST